MTVTEDAWTNQSAINKQPTRASNRHSTLAMDAAGDLFVAEELYRVRDPRGVAIDERGNIYVADATNNAIRLLESPAARRRPSALRSL
ncbi:MAG: hypothetical protein ACLQU1_36285 [Bryobacteraceae bacterium]